ncbi:MAG: hypothetical protein K6T83_01855, partial [Alicyclobacillus sp.]|nr:hypothetical protein [Alicyclobacillus sp.]
ITAKLAVKVPIRPRLLPSWQQRGRLALDPQLYMTHRAFRTYRIYRTYVLPAGGESCATLLQAVVIHMLK